ncbi:MAG: hypothetical protein ACYC7F_12240 [Gemmatimonadaceae bacterium]
MAFALALVAALGFALYTHHAWEDYWITFRASKNLATGHGLVFNVGDRLHTFTSPLGVLLPAVASLLTANSSDAAALWIFRVMSAAALGGAAALLVLTARQLNYGRAAAFFLVAWLVTDAKILDYTINGMETAFMMLFLAYALWAHTRAAPRTWMHLGAAWAGLMWTRPDSFVYIGLIAAGFWLFQHTSASGLTRKQLAGQFVRAALVTTALYLPWLLFAHVYYGTIVPHTVDAKGGLGSAHTLVGFLTSTLQLPFEFSPQGSTQTRAFLPAYFMIGGWPPVLLTLAWLAGTLSILVWLVPRLRVETRVASFAFFGAQAYLAYFPNYAYPWYLPSTTLLAFVAAGGLVQQASGRRATRWIATGVATCSLGVASWTTVQVAREVEAQQRVVEDGNRRKIGEWLRTNAAPGQTVFLEPLGYIGYYSGMKTYDFPGMSSREVVEARRLVGNDWDALIRHLHPDWLVLRPAEIARLSARDPTLLRRDYAVAREFSVADHVAKLRVYGRLALMSDARYTVFRSSRR